MNFEIFNNLVKTPKVRILFCILFFLCFFLFPNKTFAQGTSLTISPSLFRIEAKPPADVWAPFTIENHGDQALSLKIGYKAIDPFASGNGNVVFVQEGQTISGQDKKIFEKIQVVDEQNISHDSIDLGPGQKQTLRLRVLIPASEPVSDYYFSIVFLQNPQSIDQSIQNANTEAQKSITSLRTGIATTVLLAIGPKTAPEASIQTFSSPWFINHGPVPFTLSVHNSGTHFITPHGQILIKNIFGQTVGKIKVPSSTILTGSNRIFSSANSPTIASSAFINFGNKITMPSELLWNENFLLGVYTANLTLTLSDNGPVYVRSIEFISFPVSFLIEFFIALILGWFIYLRVKSKLSS
jgi:hypothetical protein